MSKQAKKENTVKKDMLDDKSDWQNKYLRALADYQNLEKRTQQEFERRQSQANKRLLLKFVKILDDMKRAQAFINDEGLKLVMNGFSKILEDEGVVEMDLVNKPYDPYLAECIEVVAGDTDNIISDVVQPGYLINGEVLQPAKVKVSKMHTA